MGAVERIDVLIVGAGISGIGSAHHLAEQCPGKSFVILESHDTFGGTWHIHRYPGTRSDSDLYTFGFRFRPWTEEPIATRERILAYLEGAIEDGGLARHIRYRHEVKTASWSGDTKLWTVTGLRKDTGEEFAIEASFLWMCQGYYRHEQGYTPDWPGMETFSGRIVHPQTWPEDLDYAGKRVLVIGSGATAATLIPAMADRCAHITMLQRSPTYFNPGNNEDTMADELRDLEVDESWIHDIVRKRLLKEQGERIGRALREPEVFASEMIEKVREYLGPDVDIAKHFTPRYRPWQQRVAFIPYGDLFKPFREGKASIVTDHIDRFEQKGVRLKSGELIEADIIVTATGFRLCVLGDIAFSVNGKPVDFSDTVTYHGMMFTGVPNLVWVFGYFRASWTLRVEIVADFVCRLLNFMDEVGKRAVTVELRPEDRGMRLMPWMDSDNFNPGYLMRDIHLMPKRGDTPEWQHTQDYYKEREVLPRIDLTSSYFHYS